MEIYYFLGHEDFHPEELLEFAKAAEKAGFDGLFVSEHFNPWVADLGASGFAFSTLGAIAAQTEKIKLMTGVVTPLFRYHPAVVSQAAATIDRLSNGRFSLGVGTGEAINEVPLGFEFPTYKERSDRMRESLKIMRSLLSGEKLTFNGEFYKTSDVKLYSPPLHNIPIYMAAGGPKSAELAAEFADGIIVSVKDPREQIEKVINPAKEKRKQLKKSPLKVVANRWSIYGKNKDEAWKALGPWRGLRAPGRNKEHDPQKLQEQADSLGREEILSKYSLVSTPQDYIKTYFPLKEMGAEIIAIQTATSGDGKSLIEMLGREVVPELKK